MSAEHFRPSQPEYKPSRLKRIGDVADWVSIGYGAVTGNVWAILYGVAGLTFLNKTIDRTFQRATGAIKP